MALKKPFLCRVCGENQPSKFFPTNKSLCKEHYVKKVQRKIADVPPPLKTDEEHKEDVKNAFEYLKAENLKRREAYYG